MDARRAKLQGFDLGPQDLQLAGKGGVRRLVFDQCREWRNDFTGVRQLVGGVCCEKVCGFNQRIGVKQVALEQGGGLAGMDPCLFQPVLQRVQFAVRIETGQPL